MKKLLFSTNIVIGLFLFIHGVSFAQVTPIVSPTVTQPSPTTVQPSPTQAVSPTPIVSPTTAPTSSPAPTAAATPTAVPPTVAPTQAPSNNNNNSSTNNTNNNNSSSNNNTTSTNTVKAVPTPAPVRTVPQQVGAVALKDLGQTTSTVINAPFEFIKKTVPQTNYYLEQGISTRNSILLVILAIVFIGTGLYLIKSSYFVLLTRKWKRKFHVLEVPALSPRDREDFV